MKDAGELCHINAYCHWNPALLMRRLLP